MSTNALTPMLRPDSEIKSAFALAIRREWTLPGEIDNANERLALREICVPCRLDDLARNAYRVPNEEPAGLQTNYIFTDVIVFCPIALPGWQARARVVLSKQVQQWREQLHRIHDKLARQSTGDAPNIWRGAMYAVPFGRFLNEAENENQWVSEVQDVKIRHDQIFANCVDARLNPTEESTICYYTRPYILWPVKTGSQPQIHVTLVNGSHLAIERTPLIHELLEQVDEHRATVYA
jgi:hypothetical protein